MRVSSTPTTPPAPPPKAPRYAVGDLISDGEETGLVIGGTYDPADGKGVYLMMAADKTLVPLNFHEVKAGVSRQHDTPGLVDLDGRNPIAAPRPQPASTRAVFNAGAAQADSRIDVLNYLGTLWPLVQKNAKPGSRIARAFAAFDAGWDTPDGPTWGAAHAALAAWYGLPLAERRRIMNGWNPSAPMPSVRGVMDDVIGSIGDESACRALTFGFTSDALLFGPENVLTHGMTDRVTVAIHEGTTKADAVARLREILVAVESQWEAAIALPDRGHLSLPLPASFPRSVPRKAEKKPHSVKPISRKLGGKERKAKTEAASK